MPNEPFKASKTSGVLEMLERGRNQFDVIAVIDDLVIRGKHYRRAVTEDDRTLVLVSAEHEVTAMVESALRDGDPRTLAAAFDPILIEGWINQDHDLYYRRRAELENDAAFVGYPLQVGGYDEVAVMAVPNGQHMTAASLYGDTEAVITREGASWLYLPSRGGRNLVNVAYYAPEDVFIVSPANGVPGVSDTVRVNFSAWEPIEFNGRRLTFSEAKTLAAMLARALDIADNLAAAKAAYGGKRYVGDFVPHAQIGAERGADAQSATATGDDAAWDGAVASMMADDDDDEDQLFA